MIMMNPKAFGNEAKCIIKLILRRIKKQLGVILIFTGETGRGKSYAGLRLLEIWYKKFFNEEVPMNHICNTLGDAILLAKDFKRKGEGIMIEELSVHAGVRDSLTTQNKMWNKFIDICRIKQIVIVGNAPHLSFIDKHFILMCQSWIDCIRVDFNRKAVITHPLWMQTSPHKKEPYRHKFVDNNGEAIDYVLFRKPSDKLVEEYEELKSESNDDIFNEIILKMREDRKAKLKKLGVKEMPRRQKEAYDLHLEGYDSTEAAEKMGLKNRRVYTDLLLKAKRRLKTLESDEKVSKNHLKSKTETEIS